MNYPRLMIDFRWIPVEEALPKDGQIVVYRQRHPKYGYMINTTSSSGAYPNEFRPGNEEGISHWFPLPEIE